MFELSMVTVLEKLYEVKFFKISVYFLLAKREKLNYLFVTEN